MKGYQALSIAGTVDVSENVTVNGSVPELGVIVKVGGGNGMPFTVIVIGSEGD